MDISAESVTSVAEPVRVMGRDVTQRDETKVEADGLPPRCFLIGLIAAFVTFTFGAIYFSTYLSAEGDGSWLFAVLRAARDTMPWEQSHISNLMGLGDQRIPINPWLNPAHSLFLLGQNLQMWHIIGLYLFCMTCVFLRRLSPRTSDEDGAIPSPDCRATGLSDAFPAAEFPARRIRAVLYASVGTLLLRGRIFLDCG